MEMEREVQARRIHGWAGALVPQRQQAITSDTQLDGWKDGWISRHQSTGDEMYIKDSKSAKDTTVHNLPHLSE